MAVSFASVDKDDEDIMEMSKRLEELEKLSPRYPAVKAGIIQYAAGRTGDALETVYNISKRYKIIKKLKIKSQTLLNTISI